MNIDSVPSLVGRAPLTLLIDCMPQAPARLHAFVLPGRATCHANATRWCNAVRNSTVILALFATVACAPLEPGEVLLYAGGGTSPGDVAAVKTILNNTHHSYTTASTAEMNAMTESQLLSYHAIIVPGGNFIDMSNGLAPNTMVNIRSAVHNGLNYLGICAGAFIAARGQYNSLNLTSDVQFHFYSAELRGVRKSAVAIRSADASVIEHYWEDGPELTGWGTVVATYPDGTPAIAEGDFGKGWVILSGVHPEAPEYWRRGMAFASSATAANAYAGTLIEATLNRTALPHY